MPRKTRNKQTFYLISAVAERFDVHPQTLRLYEREGLITPSRTEGNTRVYTDDDLERLELILNLTREMGVNLAGVEVILNMREQMESMQIETDRLLAFVKQEMLDRKVGVDRKYALVRVQSGPLAAATEKQKTKSSSRRKAPAGKRRRR